MRRGILQFFLRFLFFTAIADRVSKGLTDSQVGKRKRETQTGGKEIKKNEIDGYALLGWQMRRVLHAAQGPCRWHERISLNFFQRVILPYLTDLWQESVEA